MLLNQGHRVQLRRLTLHNSGALTRVNNALLAFCSEQLIQPHVAAL